MVWPTFRDLQSSHETLSGLDSRCLLRLPDASGPSLSEASSSPLHASSSGCSAALAGELSVSFWFIVGAGSVAGEKEPSLRMGSVLFQTASPPQHAKFPLNAQYYRGDSCVWTEFLTTEQSPSRESRSLMGGRSNSWLKSIPPRLFPVLYSLCIFHVSSNVTACLPCYITHTLCPKPRAI